MIAQPAVGADDGDLALAVTKLSREKDLAFVLVLGRLLADDADATSLELLRGDLGQLAPPVYLAVSPETAALSSESGRKAPTEEELQAALEGVHAKGAQHLPRLAPGVLVVTLGGKDAKALEKRPDTARRYLLVTPGERPAEPGRAVPDLILGLAAGDSVSAGDSGPGRPPIVLIPGLARAHAFALGQLREEGVTLELVSLEGAARGAPIVVRWSKPAGD